MEKQNNNHFSDKKLKVLADVYAQLFHELDTRPKKLDDGGSDGQHTCWMCHNIPTGDKGHRWLGWIQKTLFDKRLFSLEEIKDHVRIINRFSGEERIDEIFQEVYNVIKFQCANRGIHLEGFHPDEND